MNNYHEKFSLKGKVVFIAGGCGLIGAEISRAVASVGGQAVILDVDGQKGKALQEEIAKAGHQAVFEQFDITDLENLSSHLDALNKKHKGMHVWINATYPKSKDWALSLEKMHLDYLRQNVDLHMNSCLWSSRKAALLMREQGVKGSIINFGSIYGVRANDLTIYEGTPMAGEAVYCAIKGGIINLTRYLASHFGADGIRCNCLCPGGIFDHQNPTFVQRYEKKVPLKRMGTPQDIASVAVFLASDAASYVTGTTMMVDGGWTAV